MNSLGLNSNEYSLSIDLFTRLLGVIYIFVYIPFLFQMKGLFGKNGILPIKEYLFAAKKQLGNECYYRVATLFWINSSDQALLALIYAGIGLATLLIFGIYTPLVLLLLYIIHLSLTSAGQDFLSFGWEMLLMEITFASFLITATSPYNIVGWIALNFLLFRFYLEAGLSKIFSCDKNWRNLTALSFHYYTQPLPNTQSWYFHKLPMWFHQASALFMFYAELIVPFAIFAPPEFRIFAFTQLTALQLGIWFTGNLSYLNHLSVVFGVILLPNTVFTPFLAAPTVNTPSPLIWNVFITLLAAAFLTLQVICLYSWFFSRRAFRETLAYMQPFHLAHRHGIFAVMTTKRHEIIIEGSQDGVVWEEYYFYYKPQDLKKRPKRISPIQPRLDWQAWFLPFNSYYYQVWFRRFLIKILEGSPDVLKLLQHNPFQKNPPRYVRALAYDYEFTTFEEKKATGNWWKRRLIGEYAPPIKLR